VPVDAAKAFVAEEGAGSACKGLVVKELFENREDLAGGAMGCALSAQGGGDVVSVFEVGVEMVLAVDVTFDEVVEEGVAGDFAGDVVFFGVSGELAVGI
jgi:hypothetical protein